MADLGTIGRFLVLAGIVLVGVGLLLVVLGQVPYVGRLPGDIYIRRGPFTFYFPLVTSIILSLVLTLLINLLARR